MRTMSWMWAMSVRSVYVMVGAIYRAVDLAAVVAPIGLIDVGVAVAVTISAPCRGITARQKYQQRRDSKQFLHACSL